MKPNNKSDVIEQKQSISIIVIDKPRSKSILTLIASDLKDNELSPSKQLRNCLNLQEMQWLVQMSRRRNEIAIADTPSVHRGNGHQCNKYVFKLTVFSLSKLFSFLIQNCSQYVEILGTILNVHNSVLYKSIVQMYFLYM